jgi:hypothetical protein
MSEVATGLFEHRSKEHLAAARAVCNAGPGRAKRQQSALSNGRRLLRGIDNRNPWTRRARDLIREHTQDLGGPDNVTVAEGSIIRRIAAITSELELLESRFALSDSVDADDFGMYLAGSNCLRRLLESVGLKRRARDISAPSVAEYIDHVNGNEAAPQRGEVVP